MTGPETEKIEPYWSSPASSLVLLELLGAIVVFLGDGDVGLVGDEAVWRVEVGEIGSGSSWSISSSSDGQRGIEVESSSMPFLVMSSRREGRALSRGLPRPSMRLLHVVIKWTW